MNPLLYFPDRDRYDTFGVGRDVVGLINGIDHTVLADVEIGRKLRHGMILEEMNVLLLRSHLDALVHIIDREIRKDILQGEEIAGAVPCEPLGVRFAMRGTGAEHLRDRTMLVMPCVLLM